MTRPRKATVDYFPHACNHGKTMFILEEKWGNDGYAFWFKLLEILGATEGHVYDAGNPAAWRYLTAKTRSDDVSAADILQCLADLNAIDPDLWSEKVIWIQNFVDGIKDVYRKRAEDIPIRPDFRRRKPLYNGISGDENPQSKVKESKVNKTRENNILSHSEKPAKKTKPIPVTLPPDFEISPEVKAWALSKGFKRLSDHLESFVDYAKSSGKQYVDWDSAFKRAIRENWAKLDGNGSGEEIHYCMNHPDVRSVLSMDGRYYCRDCIRAMDKPPDPADVKRLNDIIQSAIKNIS